jgi:hypothetical protein
VTVFQRFTVVTSEVDHKISVTVGAKILNKFSTLSQTYSYQSLFFHITLYDISSLLFYIGSTIKIRKKTQNVRLITDTYGVFSL